MKVVNVTKKKKNLMVSDWREGERYKCGYKSCFWREKSQKLMELMAETMVYQGGKGHSDDTSLRRDDLMIVNMLGQDEGSK